MTHKPNSGGPFIRGDIIINKKRLFASRVSRDYCPEMDHLLGILRITSIIAALTSLSPHDCFVNNLTSDSDNS